MNSYEMLFGQTTNLNGHYFISEDLGDINHFHRIPMRSGFAFYSCDLSVVYNNNADLLLAGDAWQTVEGNISPAAFIKSATDQTSKSELLDEEVNWCGRYILIIQGEIHTDTAGLLQVFYANGCVSSSCSLLSTIRGNVKKFTPQKGKVMNWMPGPFTQYHEIFRVLPSQTYNIYTQEICARPLLAKNIAHEKDTILEDMAERCITSMKNIRQRFPDDHIMVALTGGHDSRTVFASAKASGIPFTAYTLEHERMLKGDREIPKKICETTGVHYDFIPRIEEWYSEKKKEEYMQAISYLVHDQDANYYAYHQWNPVIRKYGNCIMLRGSVWPIACGSYDRMFQNDGLSVDFYDWFGLPEGSIARSSVDEYLEWVQKHPEDGLTLSDRFFWEQREGCWASVIEAGFDLIDGVKSFQIANCRAMISMLIALDRDQKTNKSFEDELTRTLCPELSEVPYAGKRFSSESVLKEPLMKAMRFGHRIRTLGVRKTVLVYKDMIQTKRQRQHKDGAGR